MATPTPRRKTIDRDQVLATVNGMLINAKPEYRGSVCTVAEAILLDADVYGGFCWVDAEGFRLPAEQAAQMGPDSDGYYQRRYL